MSLLTAVALLTVVPSDLPEVRAVYPVSPELIGLEVQAQRVVPSKLTRYVAQPGDQQRVNVVRQKYQQVALNRGGKDIGWLIGPKRDQLVTFEQLVGPALDVKAADRPESYRVGGMQPVAVYRKSKPHDWVQPSWEFPLTHRIYLKLPHPLEAGKSYPIQTNGINLSKADLVLDYRPERTVSEAVHVSQIGYRPDDPIKSGTLSIWLGTGGGFKYPSPPQFRVVDVKSDAAVFTGTALLAKDLGKPDRLFEVRDYSLTSVYRLDFSSLRRPGRYRLVVDGVGCSLPFDIGQDPWKRAFKTQMQGLFTQRSGVELGPPYTPYRRPRDMRPEDGQEVWQSKWSVLDKAEAFSELEQNRTDEPLPEAWGGYHDAGDWNPRRVTHLRVTMAHLELLDLFPAFFKTVGWNLPPAVYQVGQAQRKAKPMPDSLKEALHGLEIFRRLQKRNGAMPSGVETNGDPIDGEVSWLQSMPLFAYAPDAWSSYVYAGAATRFSRLVQSHDRELSRIYLNSALKAMEWAENEWAKQDRSKWRSEVKDDRNLASVELYRYTGDKRWHSLFLETTVLKDSKAPLFVYSVNNQRDGAFAYALLPKERADKTVRMNAVAAICRDADNAVRYGEGNSLGIVQTDSDRPMILGYYSLPDAIQVCRAHYLTRERKYLAGAVTACQFPGGSNPMNMTFTTGVGTQWPLHPLHLDSRRTGQTPPVGITVYGNLDNEWAKDRDWAVWPVKRFLGQVCTPSAWEWPAPEAYWDIFLDPAVNEYTVDFWTPNVYVWGYLAARK